MGMSEPDAITLLANVPVFKTLGTRELARVAAVAVPRSFGPGHVIFRATSFATVTRAQSASTAMAAR
jgi:hypothetical protein